MLSAHLFLCLPCLLPPFTMPHKMVLARPDERKTYTTAVCISLWWSRGFCVVWQPAGSWHGLLIGNMVFTWDALYPAVAPHNFHGMYSSSELCCESPWYTNIQEDGCDKGVHQMYLRTERNTPVIPNWFQPYECCCCLCYPGEHLWLGTLISYKWAQVVEDCGCLKLLSSYFNLCDDTTGVVCHQPGLLGTDLHFIGCTYAYCTHSSKGQVQDKTNTNSNQLRHRYHWGCLWPL